MGARYGEFVILTIIFKDFQYLQIYENKENQQVVVSRSILFGAIWARKQTPLKIKI